MKITDIIRRSARSLGQAKIRTALTALAIAVGGFTIAISLAVGEGARQYVDTLIGSNINPQALIVAKDENFFGEGEQQQGPEEYNPNTSGTVDPFSGQEVQLEQLTDEDLAKIKATDGVKQADAIFSLSPTYVVGANEKQYVIPVSPYDESVLIDQLAAGSLPPLGERIADGTAVLPLEIIDALGYENAKAAIGETVTIRFQREPVIEQEELRQAVISGDQDAIQGLTQTETRDDTFTIVAVSEPSPTQQQTSGAILIPYSNASEINSFATEGTDLEGKYQLAGVLAEDDADPEQVKQRLIDAGYAAQTAQDLQEFIFTFVNILQSIVLGFGVIALIASVFGIVNTMYISVLERTQQIGLMKALGMRSRSVLGLFLVEAGWIGFLGGAIGALFAIVLGLALNPVITEQLNLGDGNQLLIFDLLQIGLLLLGLIIIAILSGVLPARKAAKLDPIEALRTE